MKTVTGKYKWLRRHPQKYSLRQIKKKLTLKFNNKKTYSKNKDIYTGMKDWILLFKEILNQETHITDVLVIANNNS